MRKSKIPTEAEMYTSVGGGHRGWWGTSVPQRKSQKESKMSTEAPGSRGKSCDLRESSVASSVSEFQLTASLRTVLICQMASKTIRVRK